MEKESIQKVNERYKKALNKYKKNGVITEESVEKALKEIHNQIEK